MKISMRTVAALLVAASLGGCATWSQTSVKPSMDNAGAATAARTAPKTADQIMLSENDITDRPYAVLGDIKVTVNKTPSSTRIRHATRSTKN
jgi:hypothetical protein